jgi:hypothetical protein
MHGSSRKAEKSPTQEPRHAVKYKIKPDANYVKGRASVSFIPWWCCSTLCLSLSVRTTRIWPQNGVFPGSFAFAARGVTSRPLLEQGTIKGRIVKTLYDGSDHVISEVDRTSWFKAFDELDDFR